MVAHMREPCVRHSMTKMTFIQGVIVSSVFVSCRMMRLDEVDFSHAQKNQRLIETIGSTFAYITQISPFDFI